MARVPIYITTAPNWQLITAQVVALVFFLVSIIVTFSGSGPYTETEVSTYDCTDKDQHVWDPLKCQGHQYATEDYREWTTEISGVKKSNRYWDLSLRPYRKISSPPPEKDSKVRMSLTVNTTIYYYDTQKGEWVVEKPSRRHKIDFKCHSLKFQGKCDQASLVFEDSIKHSSYKIVTEFEPSSAVGDMVFVSEKGNAGWSTLELTFACIYLVVSCVVLVLTLALLWRYKSMTWNFEQVASVALTVLLILYNNPFFAIVYLTNNLGTVIIGSIFKTLFVSGMLLFWLIYSDRIHRRGVFSLRSRNNLLKLGVVIVFFIIATIGCIVANVKDHKNPSIGRPEEIQSVAVLMGIAGFIICVVLVWTVILIALSFRSIVAAPLGRARLLYFGIPTLVTALAMIFGIFSSGIGLYSNSVSNSVFSTCYNFYVYVFAFAALPVAVGSSSGGRAGNGESEAAAPAAGPTEESGLLGVAQK